MKKLFLTTILSLLTLISTSGMGDSVIVGHSQTMVYIVMSPSAYAYHCTTRCSAVVRSTHPVKQVTVDEAVRKYGRRACGKCY